LRLALDHSVGRLEGERLGSADWLRLALDHSVGRLEGERFGSGDWLRLALDHSVGRLLPRGGRRAAGCGWPSITR